MPSSASHRPALAPLSLHDALPIYSPVRMCQPVSPSISSAFQPLAPHTNSHAIRAMKKQSENDGTRARLQGADAIRAWSVKAGDTARSEEHTSELQSLRHLVCRLLLHTVPRSPLFPYTTLFRSTHRCGCASRYRRPSAALSNHWRRTQTATP